MTGQIIFLKVYAEIKPGADFAAVDARIANSQDEHIRNVDDPNYRDMLGWHEKVMLLSHVQMASGGGGDRWQQTGSLSPMGMVWIVCLIGTFVLLLACINFMNLSTAKSEKRAREVGIRKAIGSLRMQLVWQFFGESLVIKVLVSFLFALGLTMVSLGWFNEVAGKQMVIPWANPWFWMHGVSVVFVFITGIVAGSYPALYLSSFKPAKVLKGALGAGRASVVPCKVLVVFSVYHLRRVDQLHRTSSLCDRSKPCEGPACRLYPRGSGPGAHDHRGFQWQIRSFQNRAAGHRCGSEFCGVDGQANGDSQ